MSKKYQREIEDILSQIEVPPPNKVRSEKRGFIQAALGGIGRFLGGRGCNLSPGRIMLGSVGLLLVAVLFGASMPGIVTPMIAWSAITLFILGYALFFINPNSSYEKRWRGQPIETVPGWWERLLRRIKSG